MKLKDNTKRLLTAALAVSLMGGAFTSQVNAQTYTEEELKPYSYMNMDVYVNSRVTSVEQTTTGFIVKGYMFESNQNCNKENSIWREIVFVPVDNPDTSGAYRQQVKPVYNSWLNTNMFATNNGKYDLAYANYEVAVNPNNVNGYVGNVTGQKMADGEYYVLMRISNGKQSYLFPLRDVTLSNGTNMESDGKLPNGFKVVDQETRALSYTVGTITSSTQTNTNTNTNTTHITTTTNSSTQSNGTTYSRGENAIVGGEQNGDNLNWDTSSITIK